MEPQLKSHYFNIVRKELSNSLKCTNSHEVPKVLKVVINSRIKAIEERNWVDTVISLVQQISGQKPVTTKAKESISNFKLRKGMPVGVKVTLRGNNMFEFLYKLINIVLPRIRDFRGIPVKFDGKGNYTLGIQDHTIFPEVGTEFSLSKTVGMDITIVTSAKNDSEAFELLSQLGMPFRKKSNN